MLTGYPLAYPPIDSYPSFGGDLISGGKERRLLQLFCAVLRIPQSYPIIIIHTRARSQAPKVARSRRQSLQRGNRTLQNSCSDNKFSIFDTFMKHKNCLNLKSHTFKGFNQSKFYVHLNFSANKMLIV